MAQHRGLRRPPRMWRRDGWAAQAIGSRHHHLCTRERSVDRLLYRREERRIVGDYRKKGGLFRIEITRFRVVVPFVVGYDRCINERDRVRRVVNFRPKSIGPTPKRNLSTSLGVTIC
jgi:hypothetical protein